MSKSDNIYNALDFARNKLKSATESYGEPPYTIRELNEEAAAFLANSGEL